jgi:hypothetical protein
MRQMISGIFAVIALTVAGAAPAAACGYGGCTPCGTYVSRCSPCAYVSPCTPAYDRLTDPETQYQTVEPARQYYYVNPGPTYTGPGAFAPYPTYRNAYAYRWRHHYSFQPRQSYYQGRPVLRRYY